MSSKIQIGIPCGTNSEKFALFLISTIERTISKELDYEYIIGINNTNVDKDKILQGLKQISCDPIFIEEHVNLTGSKGHGHCLNLILSRMTEKYGLFFDSDTALLTKNWDKLLLSRLKDDVVFIGSSYHISDKKIINRPNVITCAFNIDIMKMINANFLPSLRKITASEDDHNAYGVSVGDEVFLDTGCEVMYSIYSNGFKTEVLDIVSPRYAETQERLKILNSFQRGEEYHLNGIPISTHIGRSLSREFEYNEDVKKWCESIETFLNGKEQSGEIRIS